MCGRYTLATPAPKICEHFGLATMPDVSARYNIAPTQPVLAILQGDAETGRLVRWGMIAPNDPKRIVINARAETAARNSLFRGALAARRCLVIADGFYEWRRTPRGKVPMHIRLRSRAPFAFAGLWNTARLSGGDSTPACAIITTEPNPLVASIHDRMPAILAPRDYAAWLAAEEKDARKLRALLGPFRDAEMEAVAVGDAVNNARNDGPHLLDERGVGQLALRPID